MLVVAPALQSCTPGRMDVVFIYVSGLDIHKKNIVACAITPDEGKQIRTFGPMIDDLNLVVG